MQIENISTIADRLFGRALRRAVILFVVIVFGVVALYYFTAAGALALDARFGEIIARFCIGAIYAATALIACTYLWATRGAHAAASAPALDNPRETQIAMLIEAAMLGYALARRGRRTR